MTMFTRTITQPTYEMTPGFKPFTVEREIMSPTKHYAKRYKKKTKMNFQKLSG